MSLFEWDPNEYSVKVQAMDNEHQVLIQKMNALFDAHQRGADFAQLKHLLSDLGKYTVKHFEDEEAFMEKIGFDGLKTHKVVHKQLVEKFTNHAEEFEKTQELTDDFFNFLKFWLRSHIKGIDKKYGEVANAA